MRLYTILPLLLFLQLTAGEPPCDRILIKGALPTEFDFDDGTKDLKCKDGKEINIVGGKAYDNLKCEQDGWKHSNAPLSPEQKAEKELDIKCKAKACDKSYIKGPAGAFKFTSNALTCNNGKWIEISGHTIKYQILNCETGGWISVNGQLNPVPKANEELIFSCTDKDPPPTDKCIKKLIKGVPPTDFTFNNKVLKCTNGKQIIVDGNRYDELKCDETEGWKNGPTKINKVAGKELEIACKAPKCDGSYISGVKVQTNPQDGKYDNNKLTCMDSTKNIEFKKKLYPEVTCDENAGWKGGLDELGVKSDVILYVNCAVKACHQSLITGFEESKMAYDSTHKLTCKATDEAIEYTVSGKKKLAESVTCDPASKWKGQPNVDTGVLATDAFAVSCVKQAPSGPCAVPQPVPDGIIHDSVKKTLKCAPNVPAEITYQSTSYDCEGFIITCHDANGWTNGITQFAPATPSLDVSYTMYCETTEDVVYKTSSDGGSYAVMCRLPAVMEYTDGSVQSVKEMTCSKAGGWKKDGVDIQQLSSARLSDLKCQQVCDKHQQPKNPDDPDATVEANWDDGLTDLVESISKGPGKLRFECKKKQIVDTNNVIKMDGKLVNSHLYCDANGGYTDFHGTKLADASKTVKIACVDSLCKSSAGGAPLCKEADGKVPEGYKCSQDTETSPLSITDDPNQLNCKKNSNLKRIYDHESNPPVFIDDVIVCKENDHWYKYGDAKQQKISNLKKLLCMQLRCNACKQLKGTDKETYTPGTPTDCAKHTCANNLWKVKTGVNTEEEYAGEVTCSAKEGSDGKWVIDENTPIVEGNCISTGAVEACTKAAKLETECKNEWKDFKCSTITLNDDNAVTCPDGKKIFYMQRGTANFEEGAESIKCDRTKGVWTVTRSGGNDELRRGGTVVCAEKNPAPTTTTTVAPPPACDLCPTRPDVIKTCDTCEDRDIKLTTVGTKCEASVEFITEPKFETDKGLVEGKLFCKKPDYIWMDEKGEEVGKFARYKPNDKTNNKDEEARTSIIIGSAVGGAVILIIIAVIIVWTIVITRRRRHAEDDKDEETKKRMLEEGKKRKKQRGDNDEILDEVSVDAPSEIKL